MLRRTVTALDGAKVKYVSGNKEALREILGLLSALVKLYPMHVEKEDKRFFYPCMEYFTSVERQNMLAAFLAFNQRFTDKQYKQILDSLRCVSGKSSVDSIKVKYPKICGYEKNSETLITKAYRISLLKPQWCRACLQVLSVSL